MDIVMVMTARDWRADPKWKAAREVLRKRGHKVTAIARSGGNAAVLVRRPPEMVIADTPGNIECKAPLRIESLADALAGLAPTAPVSGPSPSVAVTKAAKKAAKKNQAPAVLKSA